MAPSTMSAPMVEEYAQREIIFRDEKLWLDPTLRLNKWYLGTILKFFNDMWVS